MFRNMKIGKRLMAAFGTILFLYLVSMITSLVNVSMVSDSLTTFYHRSYTTVNTAWSSRKSVISIERYLNKAMLSKDPEVIQGSIDSMKKDIATIESDIPIIEKAFTGDPALISQLKTTFTQSNATTEQIYSLLSANQMEAALKLVNETYMPALDSVRMILSDIGYVAEDEAIAHYKDGEAVKTSAFIMMIVLTLVCISITLFIYIKISRSITIPILELEQAADKIASGNLKTEIQYQSIDELGGLADSMRRSSKNLHEYVSDIGYVLGEMEKGNMLVSPQAAFEGDFVHVKNSITNVIATFRSTLTQISHSSVQVAGGSDQVSNGAQALSQGATQQASSVEELASTFNDISQQVKNTADNAIQASKRVNAVGDEAMESNRRMQNMLSAMSDISSSSGEIGKIMKTIEDISFQTNILALNAAVEAARAGTAGKGFAVVADEVRNLAIKSSEASKNTAGLIENSLNAVKNGTNIADETAQSLKTVVDGVREVSETIDKISAASNDQAQSILQVTQGIDQISSVVQHNSATAQESAAASEELSGQAQILKDLTGKFQLGSI